MELSIEVETRSAGTLGISGQPAHAKMQAAAREIGLDLSAHVSQGLEAEHLRWADRVLVMELGHAAAVELLDPSMTEQVIQLGPLAGQVEIVDPTGSWFVAPYRHTRDEIARAVRRFLTASAEPS